MCTASLHCGMVCCARGFWTNAPKDSGVSGATRAHYDARALSAVRRLLAFPFKSLSGRGSTPNSAAEDSIQKLKSQRIGALALRTLSLSLAWSQKLWHTPPIFLKAI